MDCEEEMISNIRAVEEEGAQIVIVSFHWGVEKEYYPNDTQMALAHSAVDNGADLVLGHHPHVLRASKNTRGKTLCTVWAISVSAATAIRRTRTP